MEQANAPFDLVYNQQPIHIRVIPNPAGALFVASGNSIPAVCIHRAVKRDGQRFWTSIPEGKQQLAEAIGSLIEKHLHANQ